MSHSQCRVSSHSFMCYFSFLGPTGFSLYSAHQGHALANTERTTTARTRAAATEDDGANRRCTGCVAATTEDGGADASARRAAEPAVGCARAQDRRSRTWRCSRPRRSSRPWPAAPAKPATAGTTLGGARVRPRPAALRPAMPVPTAGGAVPGDGGVRRRKKIADAMKRIEALSAGFVPVSRRW